MGNIVNTIIRLICIGTALVGIYIGNTSGAFVGALAGAAMSFGIMIAWLLWTPQSSEPKVSYVFTFALIPAVSSFLGSQAGQAIWSSNVIHNLTLKSITCFVVVGLACWLSSLIGTILFLLNQPRG